jgi:hypothetical protein
MEPLSVNSTPPEMPLLLTHIICDGRRLDIGQNLFNALSTLRDVASQELKSFWVDATCINQQDTKERGQQVARMAGIYRNADSVIVLTGR